MHFLPGKRAVIVFLAVASLLILPLAAQAELISADLSGSRSTPDATGIHATDGWATSGVNLSWLITPQVDGSFFYQYTFTTSAGNPLPAISHFDLAISPIVTSLDGFIWGANGSSVVGPTTFGTSGSRGTSPFLGEGVTPFATFWGVKFDYSDSIYSFYCAVAPIWGDFYIKDGTQGTGTFATAQNTGLWLGLTPELGGNFTNFVAVPDTGDIIVPIPPSALLLGSGLLGLGLIGWRRREKKA